jgi:hypothetical protein
VEWRKKKGCVKELKGGEKLLERFGKYKEKKKHEKKI